MELVPQSHNNDLVLRKANSGLTSAKPRLKFVEHLDRSNRFHPEATTDRVVIVIDGSSLFHAASYLQLEVDYTKLLHYFTQGHRLLRAYFYTGVDRTNG